MKNFILVIFLSITLSVATSQGIQFYEGSFDDAITKAKVENKHVFVDAYTTWCGPCKAMAKNVFTQAAVGEFYNEKFINLKLDMEKGDGIAFAQKHNVRMFPTYLFFNGDGTLVHRSLGSKKAQEFIADGSNAINDETSLMGMQARYNEGECTNEFLKNYAYTLMYAAQPQQHVIADQYINTLSDEELKTKDNLTFVATFADDVGSLSFKKLIQNKEAAIAAIGQQKVENIIRSAAFNSLASAVKGKSKAELRQLQNTLIDTDENQGKKYAAEAEVEYYKQTRNFPMYAQSAIGYISDFNVNDASQLNNIAWTFYEQVEKKKYIKHAVKWAEKSVSMDDKYYNNDTLAALLFKLGKKKEAIAAAEKAIALGKAEGYEPTETIELLNKINAL